MKEKKRKPGVDGNSWGFLNPKKKNWGEKKNDSGGRGMDYGGAGRRWGIVVAVDSDADFNISLPTHDE